MAKGITRNVVILGFVSFLTDVSSEMIYPLLPLFLTQVLGAGPGFLGLVEGAAESISAFLKLLSGIWADRIRDRAKLILGGYTLSSFSRPLIAAAQHPWTVFWIRFSDRIGKGIRTSPRDALIADSVEPNIRGRAFGFQRSMDHAGAAVGPLIAAYFLSKHPGDFRTLFWLAGIPAVLAVLLILFRVREVLPLDRELKTPEKFRFKRPEGKLGIYLAILLLFMLSNSSDAFLLLHAGNLGISAPLIPILWMMLHLVRSGTTFPFGILSDRLGRRRLILAGWSLYALVYAGFAFALNVFHVWILFFFYGLFTGLTEGVERALLADLSDPAERGQAFGWYNFVVGIAALPASFVFGLLWQSSGAGIAFLFDAALAGIAALLLFLFIRRVPSSTKP